MEPPTKRPRLSGPDTISHSFVEEPRRPTPGQDLKQQNLPKGPRPTRTLDLSSFRRRSLERRGVSARSNAGFFLFPRAPDVTVTANVVNIAVVDGSEQVSTTEMPAPTSDTEVAIPNQGIVTVSGVAPVTSAVDSLVSGVTQNPLPTDSSTISDTGTLLATALSGNATSDRTITVTSTSTLEIGFRNGTAFRTSAVSKTDTRYQTTTIDGVTSTIDTDSSSTDSPTYVFGDLPSSSVTQSNTDGYNAAAITSTSTTTSSSAATSTDSGSGGGVVLTPQQQQMVGGLVGGVAGVALVLVALLYFLKWYRQHLKAQGRLPEQIAHRQLPSGDDHEYTSPAGMSQPLKSSILPIATFKQSLQKLRPHSVYTLTSSSTERSSIPAVEPERGFQRVSGRKIPSVLLTGGDGYGDPVPASPPSEYSSYSRSRDVSQTSSFRDSNNSTSPFLTSGGHAPGRSHTSPFADPPGDGSLANHSISGTKTSARDFALLDGSRSQLNLQTGGLAALTPKKQSDANITIRPSPARTPMTASPTSSSLKLPMHTPPLMSGDIPEMPPLHPLPSIVSRQFGEIGANAQRSMGQRSISSFSARSSSSTGGRFKENI